METRNKKPFTKGQEVTYTGKGFISFDPDDTKMIVIEKEGKHDYWVKYKGMKMLVNDYEIKPLTL